MRKLLVILIEYELWMIRWLIGLQLANGSELLPRILYLRKQKERLNHVRNS